MVVYSPVTENLDINVENTLGTAGLSHIGFMFSKLFGVQY